MAIQKDSGHPISPFADRQQTEIRDSILYAISIFSFLIPRWFGRLRARAF
jgi:hypothetical protein